MQGCHYDTRFWNFIPLIKYNLRLISIGQEGVSETSQSTNLKPSTDAERADFHAQERRRFSRPNEPFTYKIRDRNVTVGPIGFDSSQSTECSFLRFCF